jgi:glycosyltransferase involved in cell wall biosynthesis
MLADMGPDLVAVAAYEPTPKLWNQRIPVVPLERSGPKLWRRIARRMGIAAAKAEPRERRLAAALAKADVTAIVINYIPTALSLERSWAAASKPVYIHCHGYDVTWDFREHSTPDVPAFDASYVEHVRRLSKQVIFIANSNTTEQRLRDIGVPPERIVVRYPAIPIGKPCPTPAKVTSPVNILYLGRLIDCKAPDLVIRAFEVACQRGLDGTLTIAGDGPLRLTCELLKRRSRYAESINIVGPVNASTGEALRSQAHIFTAHNCRGVLSRQEESFGVSLVEAMGAGLPVVTGNSGGVREIVVDGETGFLVPPGDVDAHAEALLRLSRDSELRTRMGECGWARAFELFSSGAEQSSFHRIWQMDGRS